MNSKDFQGDVFKLSETASSTSGISKFRSIFNNKLMIILLSGFFVHAFPKVVFSEQIPTEISTKKNQQTKEEFVADIIEEIYEEIEKYAENHEGNVYCMGKDRSWEQLKTMKLFDKMLQGIFYNANPSGHGIVMISNTSPQSMKKILSLDMKLIKKYNLLQVREHFQVLSNIAENERTIEAFNRFKQKLNSGVTN